MRVGMNRSGRTGGSAGTRVPHACGDEPVTAPILAAGTACSPCVWG